MLEIVTGQSRRNCQGSTRREFLRIGTLGLGGVSLASLLAAKALGQQSQQAALRDKSVVMLFLTGGPSQIETFDPKMTAPSDYRSVTGAASTKIPGVEFGGTFPQLAAHAEQLAVIRSFTHDVSDHTKAVEQVIRGGNPVNHAGMGSIASRLRGTSHPSSGMPTHVYLSARERDRQFNKERLRLLDAAGPGDMGGAFAPFQVGGNSQVDADMQLLVSPARLDDRLSLNKALDQLNRRLDRHETLQSLDRFTQQALDLVLGKSRAAFDISQEPTALIERYDTSHHVTGIHADRASTLGKQMLLARRLCEAGCGFITIHNPGWDMHGGDTQLDMLGGMEELGRPVDRAVSAFLEDIEGRGLSEQILLVITGEFGRSPRVKDNGGRDHWPRLSTLAFAGGGLRMGQVIGRSTAKAEEPRSDPITLDDLFATVMHVLFDVQTLRTQASVPRDIVTLLERGQPIRDLV